MGLFFQTIGSSLKLLPAAVWDELHIFLTSFHKIKWPTNIALQLLLFWQIYMIFISLANGYGQSITFLRYGLVFVGLVLLKNYYRSLLIAFSKNFFFMIGLMYFGISIGLYIFGIALGLPVAWWQETLWVGTAYSAFVIYIIIAIILMNSFSINQRLIFLGLGFVSGVLMDSRLVFVLLFTLLPFIFSGDKKSNLKKSLFSSIRSFLFFVFIISSLSSVLINYNKEINSVFKSTQATIYDLTSETNSTDRDADRRDNIRAVASLMNDDPFTFIFGSGLTSHQYELSEYLDNSADNKVRPSGVPAVVFDGGIIYLLLIFICACNSILQFISYYLNNLISFRTLSILALVITNSFIVLFITNTTDLMLWWAVILSGQILNKELIHEFNNRFA